MPKRPGEFKLRYYCILISISAMLAGLFYSRALLTGGCFFLLVTSLTTIRSSSFSNNRSNYYNILLFLLFLIPLISGLWSSNITEWWQRSGIKLPFLILPFALSLSPLKRKDYVLLSAAYIAFVFAGTIWSFIEYLNHSSSIREGYLKSSLLEVGLNNDHVLFSWAIVIAMLLLSTLNPLVKTRIKINLFFNFIVVGWLLFFLHLLAARTGLICFYLSAFTWGVYKIKQRSFEEGTAIIIFIIVLPFATYFLVPTFHNRLLYVLYDLQQYRVGNFPPGFSDVSRILSYKGGIDITRLHFFTGVGFGDVAGSMQNWYQENFRYLPQHDRILPHNEWLMYSCGAGIFAVLIFTYIVVYPFFIKRSWIWIAFHSTAVLCFMTDATLEIQNGVFLYCFFICWLKMGIDYNKNCIPNHDESYMQ